MAKKLPGVVKKVRNSRLKYSRSNNNVSYSHLSVYSTCKKKWYLQYVKKLAPFDPSIYLIFGTAMHDTIQNWLTVMYDVSVKASEELNLADEFHANLIKAYKKQKAQNSYESFSNPGELKEFYGQGVEILNFLKKKRKVYFSRKQVFLAGVETMLYQEIRPGVFFKGYVDLVFYDKQLDKWTIIDIKTSTKGWNAYKKKDESTLSQLLLYKEFFAKQFNVDVDKIEIKYLIVKRIINEDAEYAAMRRRVQEYVPPSGKIKRGKALTSLKNFIENTIDENGEFIDKDYPASPGKFNCGFCVFQNMKICTEAYQEK